MKQRDKKMIVLQWQC